MAIHAKATGAYSVGTTEWDDNVNAFWSFSSGLGYSEEAFSGMMGNCQHEGGMNPWRWQSDQVNLSAGYGLFQYTPASGYINTYGPLSSRYAPNTQIPGPSPGADPEDGLAQIEVIDASGKYVSNTTRRNLLINYVPDCDNYTTLAAFKTVTDISKATYLWVGFFECPGWWLTQTDVSGNMQPRLDDAQNAYDLIHIIPPTPTGDLIMWGGARESIRRYIKR